MNFLLILSSIDKLGMFLFCALPRQVKEEQHDLKKYEQNDTLDPAQAAEEASKQARHKEGAISPDELDSVVADPKLVYKKQNELNEALTHYTDYESKKKVTEVNDLKSIYKGTEGKIAEIEKDQRHFFPDNKLEKNVDRLTPAEQEEKDSHERVTNIEKTAKDAVTELMKAIKDDEGDDDNDDGTKDKAKASQFAKLVGIDNDDNVNTIDMAKARQFSKIAGKHIGNMRDMAQHMVDEVLSAKDPGTKDDMKAEPIFNAKEKAEMSKLAKGLMHDVDSSEETKSDSVVEKHTDIDALFDKVDHHDHHLNALLEKAKALDTKLNSQITHTLKNIPEQKKHKVEPWAGVKDSEPTPHASAGKKAAPSAPPPPPAAETSVTKADRSMKDSQRGFLGPALFIFAILGLVACGIAAMFMQKSAKVGDVAYAQLSTDDIEAGDIGYMKNDSDAESDLGLEDADYMVNRAGKILQGTATPISETDWPSPLADPQPGQTPVTKERFPRL